MGSKCSAAPGVLGLALLLVQLLPSVEAVRSRQLLALLTNKGCSLPEEGACSYVLNTEACAPRSGVLHYLAIYACQLDCYGLPATLLTALWIGFLFVVMFTVADRFFCPAMELLSEWLHLSPAVAGATLLALGNGACDVFTQVAAAQSGDLENLSMSLSEPMGTSLFVGNVVLGITVAMAHGTAQHVTLRPSLFLKDALFYLGSVLFMLVCLLLGKIYFWQCLFLVVTWACYVCLTVWLCKDEESVQLDPLQHEVPRLVPFGPWDDLDSDDLEDWDWLEALPTEYRDLPHTHYHQAHSAGVHSTSGGGGGSGHVDEADIEEGSSHNPATAQRTLRQSVSAGHTHPSRSLLTSLSDGRHHHHSSGALRGNVADPGEQQHRSVVPGTDRRQIPSWLQAFQRMNTTCQGRRRQQPGGGQEQGVCWSVEDHDVLAQPLLLTRTSQGRLLGSRTQLSASYDEQAVLAFKEAVSSPSSPSYQLQGSYQPPAPPHQDPSTCGPRGSRDKSESDDDSLGGVSAGPTDAMLAGQQQADEQGSALLPELPVDVCPIQTRASADSVKKPPVLSRIPSKRQTEGLVSFVRSVSTRFRYPSTPGGEEGDAQLHIAGGSPESSVTGPNPFSPEGEQLRTSKSGAATMDEGLYVPLLMEGRLDQLQELLTAARKSQEEVPEASQKDKSLRGSSSTNTPAGLLGGSPAGQSSPAVFSDVEGASPGGASPTARSNPDLALEKKRLMKLIYYGHQKRKQDANSAQMATQAVCAATGSDNSNGLAQQPTANEGAEGLPRAVTFSLPQAATEGVATKDEAPQPLTHDGSFERAAWLGRGSSGGTARLPSNVLDAQLSEVIAADVSERVKRLERSRQAWHWQLWRAVRRPLVLLLSFTMPMIERRQHLHYTKASAVMLPLVGPPVYGLMYGWWNPFGVTPSPEEIQPLDAYQLQVVMVCCCATSLLVLILWRSDGVLDGPVVAICAALSFIGSMVWMNAVASELVGLLVAVGNVLDLPAALLGATVLSWGNSLPDAVSNSTMARDGYPTMAITACFASPLFVLLAGVACSLSIGSLPGALALPQDVPTLILYSTSSLNMIMWVITIPWVFKFKLDWRVTLLGCGFYAVYQVAYVVYILRFDEPSA